MNKHDSECDNDLANAISRLTHVLSASLEWTKSHHGFVTKHDLERTESNILMKLSEVKTAVAEASADSTEAFAELGTRIADLDKQIADLVAAASDPEVTDEVFLTNLQSLRTSSKALKDIVPNETTP